MELAEAAAADRAAVYEARALGSEDVDDLAEEAADSYAALERYVNKDPSAVTPGGVRSTRRPRRAVATEEGNELVSELRKIKEAMVVGFAELRAGFAELGRALGEPLRDVRRIARRIEADVDAKVAAADAASASSGASAPSGASASPGAPGSPAAAAAAGASSLIEDEDYKGAASVGFGDGISGPVDVSGPVLLMSGGLGPADESPLAAFRAGDLAASASAMGSSAHSPACSPAPAALGSPELGTFKQSAPTSPVPAAAAGAGASAGSPLVISSGPSSPSSVPETADEIDDLVEEAFAALGKGGRR